MALTGCFLVLFVTFHVLMNGVALFWPEAYNMVCAFLGANWYALVGTVILAAGFALHIIYAIWLTLQNRKARGNDPYKIASAPKQVEWSSRNMLVLGFVILAFLVVHMIQFWAKMQLVEIAELKHTVDPANGYAFIMMAFSQWWTPVIYIIAFIALWFHMTHGFWSMFQTVGWNNKVWMDRVKTIGNWWTSIVVLLFIAEAVTFTVKASCPDCNPYYYQCNAEECVPAEDVCLMENEECDGICDEACANAKECDGICDEACPNAGECTEECAEECTADF